jgi:hypothetical protein
MTRIYISSSWKNRVRVREIADLLRLHGYDVYDFTDPRCGADSHADWGVAVGTNKRTVVMGHPKAGERTPSHMWAEAMIPDDNGALIDWIERRGAYA